MTLRLRPTRFGRDSALWLTLLLVLVVLVPTACVLWLLGEATQSERLAVRQRLDEAYRSHLRAMQGQFQTRWERRLQSIASLVHDRPAPMAFSQIAGLGLADSAIVFDSSGDLLYPSPPGPPADASSSAPERGASDESDRKWRAAEELEYVQNDQAAAAAVYRELADTSPSADMAARAFQAQARCLLRAGQSEAALRILSDELQADSYHSAVDRHGRWIAADADLRILQIAGPRSLAYLASAKRLLARLRDYEHPLPRAPQRLFLMHELRALVGEHIRLPTFAAEEMAAQWLASRPSRPTGSAATAGGPGLWQANVADGRAVALFREETLRKVLQAAIDAQPLPEGTAVVPMRPGDRLTEGDEFLSASLAPSLPGWRLALFQTTEGSLDSAAGKRTRYYLSTAVLMVLTTTALAAMVGSAFRRQVRLTHLKNDLVATVSHELKTPLSSIRVLVDTLLEEGLSDAVRAQEYLELIARENARLSRLIENFLTFSRIERGKQTLDRAAVDPAKIVERAVEAVGERLTAPGSTLRVEIGPALPRLWADEDALVTILINLLDNAIKYTGDNKQITARATAAEGEMHFVVEDNGVGLDPHAARRVFDRFYQVDRSLARGAEGCGLGLSIVRSLAMAHGGRVSVESKPGRGSTFTVSLPVTDEKRRRDV